MNMLPKIVFTVIIYMLMINIFIINYTHSKEHLLRRSWIWDFGSDGYICNATMKDYLKDFHEVFLGSSIIVGKFMTVKSYVNVMIYVTKNSKRVTIDLINVLYIFDFLINFVSIHKAEFKGMLWD